MERKRRKNDGGTRQKGMLKIVGTHAKEGRKVKWGGTMERGI